MTNTQSKKVAPSIALITGGSRGLGRSMALELAARGVDVILTYRSQERDARDVVDALRAKGRKAHALKFDASDTKGLASFVSSVEGALAKTFEKPRFQFLVNNAGMGVHKSFAETTEEEFDELMLTHLKAPFFLTQRLLPLIADGGRILNVSSGLARFTLPGYAAYATMKGGIEVLTRYLAKELGARAIAVNTLAPGAIETDFGGGVVRDDAQVNAFIASQTALGRVGLPGDIGQAVSALLAPEFGWLTGQRIEVSGGMLL